MEFNEKLQKLRSEKNLTQEELAEMLFVSRTAISKWESGRGLPNIDSLKAISKVFSVSIDELLSGEELIQAAEDEKKKIAISLRGILYGLLDEINILLFFIPVFASRSEDAIKSISLFSMNATDNNLYYIYIICVIMIILFGIMEISLQNFQNVFWKKSSGFISIGMTVVVTVIFVLSSQPYAAFLELWILVTKGVLYAKQHGYVA